jgi:tetratricopeptide (TPR) repeat protein
VRQILFAPAVAALLLCSSAALADTAKKSGKEDSSFGSLRGPDVTEVQKQAEAWLKSVGKQDAKVKAIWEADRPVIDKVTAIIVLGDPQAAKLLEEARDADAPAPVDVPKLLKDKTKSAFYRNNLSLAYAKALTGRKVYEEALEAFAQVKPEEVVDPASYLFHKAVCEYELMMKDKADMSIDRLLVDVMDSPERYRMVAALMHFDMLTWQEKDLGWIARKMGSIQRRLDLKRGGKQTQRQQKEVLVRLDEMIKELENKQKQQGQGDPNEGNCPGGGQPGPDGPGKDKSTNPQNDTQGGTANGSGNVDMKKVKEIAEVWGKLPEKERVAALRELTRAMPAKDRAVVEAYFKELQKKSSK